MRGKACSAEFMRRFERLAVAAGWQPHAKRGRLKPVVQALSHQFCLDDMTIYHLLEGIVLQKRVISVTGNTEVPHPTILTEAVRAGPQAEQVAKQAIEEGWTAKQVRQEVRRLKTVESPPLPDGVYSVIVLDPPWPYQVRAEDTTHRARLPYPSMTMGEILKLHIPLADDGILWLWTTNAFMHEALHCLAEWNCTQKTILTWVKPKMGVGNWLRGQTEHCLLAVRGSPPVRLTNQTTVLYGDSPRHSQKPEEFYALVEALCPSRPLLEMFARTRRSGWVGWGADLNG